MRQTYYEGADTLRTDELPSVKGCELDYCSALEPNAGRQAIQWVLFIACIGAAAIPLARLSGTYFPIVAILGAIHLANESRPWDEEVPFWQRSLMSLMMIVAVTIGLWVPSGSFSDWLQNGHASFDSHSTILFIVVGLILGFQLLARRRPPYEVAIVASSGLLLVLFLFLLNQLSSTVSSFSVLSFCWVLAAVCLADALIRFHCGVLRCGPRIPAQVRKDWRLIETLTGRSDVAQYRVGVAIAGLILAFAQMLVRILHSLMELKPLAGAISMTVLAIFSGLAIAASAAIQKPEHSVSDAFESSVLATLRAIRQWLVYNPNPDAAGVYRGPLPWDVRRNRCYAVAGCILLSFAAVLPMAHYFPMFLSNVGEWKRVIVTDSPSVAVSVADDVATAFYGDIAEDGKSPSEDRPGPVRQWRNGIRDDFAGFMSGSPERWVPIAFEGIGQGRPLFVVTILLSLILSITIPVLILFSLVVAVAGPVLSKAEEALTAEEGLRVRSDWDGYVRRIQNSRDRIERESLLIGKHDSAGYPVLVHRSMLREHGHILGDTGSGKTAMGFAPMVSQLIRMAGRDARRNAQRASVIIVDLKGDRALFQGARVEAHKAGIPFRWFTNQTGVATHVFNPFLQPHVTGMTNSQWAQTLTEALSLSYGDGYGREYFSGENEDVLAALLGAFEGQISSFKELSDYCSDDKADLLGKKLRFDKKKREDAQALFTLLKRLAPIAALNATPKDYPAEVFRDQIDLGSVFDQPQVVYFYLQSGIEAGSTKRIGKLALYSLLSAAVNRGAATNSQVYLFIDEFQQIASQNIEIILRQARSMNIATILAHQTVSDLLINDTDLTPTVQANTRFKQFFAASDLNQQKSLVESSGDTIDHVLSWGNGASSGSNGSSTSANFSWAESVQPRLTRNDIIRMTDDPTKSVVHLPRGAGYARFGGFPFVVSGLYHITEAEYDRRLAASWPKASKYAGTIVPRSDRSRPTAQSAVPEAPPMVVPEPTPDSGFDDVFNQLHSGAKKRHARRRKQSRGK